MSKAGHLSRCCCCHEEHDEHESSYDEQLSGPVCEDCRVQIRGALAWMKLAKIDRPLDTSDITTSNINRLTNLM